MNKHNIKCAITEAVLKELPEGKVIPIQSAMSSWWVNFRNEGGMRLTDVGLKAFKNANIQSYTYDVDIDRLVDGGMSYTTLLLQCNNKINCPYYIGRFKDNKQPYIKIFDDKIAMLISLYGDFYDYLISVKKKTK
jgi:hypothetical protein